jgi:hypothetical protein
VHTLFKEAIDGGDGVGEWLLDDRLKSVWARLDDWLSGVPQDRAGDAAAFVVGALALPEWLIPDPGARGREMSISRRIRTTQKIAGASLKKAAAELRMAAAHIVEARERSTVLPDAVFSIFHFFAHVIPKKYRANTPSYFHAGLDTVHILNGIADELEAGDSLRSIPGFDSQKESWRDWLREAAAGVAEAGEIYGRPVPLREADWVRLAQAVMGDLPGVSRDSVRDGLRGVNEKI